MDSIAASRHRQIGCRTFAVKHAVFGRRQPKTPLRGHAELVSASYEIPKQVRNDKIWLYEKLSPQGILLKAQDLEIIA